ncbi:MAG: enoyl-CoA hydratase-related protein [Dehalococcoidales bacterium]|nr:enoyl-CoA hydratase-related protein [Dehalococcoidales bacterium]
MELKTVLYEKKDNVAWITMNRPDVLNAQNAQLRNDMLAALDEARLDDEVYIIVLGGAGRAFSAGADISEWPKMFPMDTLKDFYGNRRFYELMRAIPKPIIAMVNGYALGGGCEAVMACDIVIASEKAKFGQPEVKIGIIPGGGGTQILPRLIGEKRAKELVMTGDFITAQEAWQMGLVNKVVPPEKLLEATQEMVAKLKTQSPVTLKFCKLAVNKSLQLPLDEGLKAEQDIFALCFSTEDQKEGAKAFLEKRTPKYKGK